MNTQREVKPPPTMYSGKLPAIQLGVVQATMLIQGFSIVSLPLIFVVLLNTVRPSQRVTRRSTISRSCGFRRLPSSPDSMVISAAVSASCPLMRNCSWLSLRDLTRLCHVHTSGPNLMPGIFLKRFIATPAVVDLDTIPGGATRMIKKLGVHLKYAISNQTRRRRAPASALTPHQKRIRLGASE